MTASWSRVPVAIGLAAMALGAAPPAEAQYWGRYRHRGGDTTGAALLGGIVGLGVGAAIASSARPRYYDRGYYAPPPPPPPIYNSYYSYAPAPPPCWTERRYDPYYGYSVPVQVCR